MTLYPHRIARIGDLHRGQGRAQVPENQVCREKNIIERVNEFAKVYSATKEWLIERGENYACINGTDWSEGTIPRTGTRVLMRFSLQKRRSRAWVMILIERIVVRYKAGGYITLYNPRLCFFLNPASSSLDTRGKGRKEAQRSVFQISRMKTRALASPAELAITRYTEVKGKMHYFPSHASGIFFWLHQEVTCVVPRGYDVFHLCEERRQKTKRERRKKRETRRGQGDAASTSLGRD